ncbi:hypothetical protein ACOSQ3_003892 [Xanthoceras sorbifolium]
MDKNKDYVSIDFKKLADSLRGEFDTLYPLSNDCCIYRVPPKIRMLNESLYTPKMVSIGPFHHGSKELQAMEEHKLRYLQQFLQRTFISLEYFLMFIKGKEENLRACYAETIKLESEAFVKMVLLDAVFLIEIFLRYSPEFESVDRIFTKPGVIKYIMFDILSLENQLPIFILEDLFKLANPTLPEIYNGYSLSQFTSFPFKNICEDFLIDEALLKLKFSKARHFVDLIRLCLRPPNRNDTKMQADSENAPSITKLHLSGVKFEVAASDKNLLDITFNNGILKIPKLTISNMTLHLLRNLQIFEDLHCTINNINQFNTILNRLLSDSKDVELLTQNGVIVSRILDSEGVSTFFRQLNRDARVQQSDFYYSGLVKHLQKHCKSRCHKLKANLKQDYFNTPWAYISFGAAAFILILTFIQAVCSIIGLI